MDLVKIGFQINANGLKDANTEVDNLLNKVDNIGTKGKKASSDFESSQKKVKASTQQVTKEVDKTSKALEKQRIIGDYLGKGLDKTTATSIASFKQLGATVSQTNEFISNQLNNKGLEQTRKELAQLGKEQQKQQEQQAKLVQDTVTQYEKLSNKSLGGGILDSIEQQNKGLEELKKQYRSQEKEQQKALDDIETARQKHFSKVQKDYEKQQQAIVDTQQKAIDKQIKAQNTLNESNQKAITLEQAKAKYVSQGYGKTDSTRLARLEVSGADVATLNNYKSAIDSTRNSMRNLTPVALTANKSNNTLLASIKGIAAYALLSTAIYGTITALADLAISIVSTADEMANLTQRLNIYLPANIKVNQVLERMGEIAKENRVTLSDTGKLFTQLLPPIQRIKGGVAETTAIVDAFGKAMLVGGANTMEAASATIQFGQAMASGKLAGDEFRSLAEASPRLLQAIADGAGIAAQKLKEMSAAGKLTSGLVSAALLDQFIQLEYEATKMGQTVSGAFNEGMVAYQLFVNTFNEQTGFTTSIVEGIRSVVKSLEGFGKGFLASLKDGDSTLNSFLGLLRTVLDIVGAVVGGFTDVVGWILKAGEKTGLWKSIFDTTKLAIITIVDTLAKIPFVIVNIGTRIAELVLKPFEKFIELAQKGLDLAGFDSAAARLGQGLSNYRGFMGDIKGTTGEVITGFNLLSLGVKETENSTGNVKDILDKLKQQNKDLVIQEKEKKAMTDSQYISEYAKLLLQKEGVDVNAENLNLVKKELEERFKITQEEAKQLKIAGEAQAKKDEAEAKAKKASEEAKKTAEQEQKRLQGIRASYDDQISAVSRLNKFKAEGMSYDVAKIAAEKDYYEAYTNVEKAFELAEARKTLARIDAKGALENETLLLTKLLLLQEKGVGYELARTLAQAAFSDDQEGMLAAAQSMHNELVAQQYSLADQVKQQTLLNHYLDKGLTLEEATVKASFKRLENIQKEAGMKGLSDQQKKLKEDTLENQKQLKIKQTEAQVSQSLTNAEKQRVAYVNAQAGGYANLIKNMAIANKIASDPTLSPDQAKKLVEAEELTNYEKELAELKRQTYIATLNESDAVKTLVGNYSTMDSVQIGVLANQQRLLEIAKELAEEAEKQRNNPIGDFSNVDFSVFGDFGNPFQSALDGMNALIQATAEGGEIIKQLTEEIDAAKIMGLDTADRELELGKRTEKQANDKKKATDKAITSGLALTKSLFKEESKGYKVVSGLEKAYQASKIAFALWEKKDTIKTLAIKVAGYAKDMVTFIGGVGAKIAAQMGLNVAQAQGAVASAAQAPPPVGFASAAAMIALLAGIGIAISGGGSSGGEYVDTSNQGTGTVFGDSEAQSESIKKSIDILSDNSDLMLPLTSAMLRSLKNIESSIGGVTNLILRGELGGDFSNLGFEGKLTGVIGTVDKIYTDSSKIMMNVLTLGLDKLLLGGALGNLASGIFSTVLGGLFGKTSQEVMASGLYADDQKLSDILSNGIDLKQYADVKTTKKSWFSSSSSTSTQYGSVDDEIKQQFTLIFGGFYDTILSATNILGADMDVVKTNLENAVISIGKINLQGLSGEEIQEKLEAVFGAAADDLAKQAFGGLEDFQSVGEGYYETLMKVASAVEEAAYYTDRLNVTAINYNDIINKQADDLAAEIIRQSYLAKSGISTVTGGMSDLVNNFSGSAEEINDFISTLEDLQDQLFMTGKSGDYLTSTMILGAGGLDSLASGLDAYFEMLSPAEQAAELTRRLTNEFAIFGKELPSDVKAFRNLVSSIDITTASGQKLYGQIIALAPEFNDLQDAIESANSEVNALVQSLRDLAEQARAARGETEQPRDLAYLRNEFNKASELALQGDTEAANRLISIGKDLMSMSKLYSVTGSDYARDLAFIQGVATAVADLHESGLGTSISSDLKPSTGTGTTTPTVETVNNSTDARLDALSEKLEAGLFAIAKYTQDSASRLERWDDGGRMMVGIQPENGDTPVPVVVTP